jgi:hypothetical protein
MPFRAEHQLDRINIGKIFKDLKLKTQFLHNPKTKRLTSGSAFIIAQREMILKFAGKTDSRMSKP